MPEEKKFITLAGLAEFKRKCDETYRKADNKSLVISAIGPDGDETVITPVSVSVVDGRGESLYEGTFVGLPIVLDLPKYTEYHITVTPQLTIEGIVYFNPTSEHAQGVITDNTEATFQYASTEGMTTLQDVKTFLALESVSLEVKRAALVSTETNNFTVDITITNPANGTSYTMPIRFVEVGTYKKLVNGVEVSFVGARCMFNHCLPDNYVFDEREQVLATGETFQSGVFYYQGTAATLSDQSFTPLVEGTDYQVGDTVGANIYKHAWSNQEGGQTGNKETKQAMRYGSNVYHESNIDKWLNASGDNWFVASHIGDVLASGYSGKKGFKDWFDEDDLATIEDNVAYGVYERDAHTVTNNTIYRKFVLPSGTNLAGSVNANEGNCFDYWKYLNGGVVKNDAKAERTITKINAKTSKQTCWLRSPTRSFASYAWTLYSNGFIGNGNAYYAYGVAPVFTI